MEQGHLLSLPVIINQILLLFELPFQANVMGMAY
jgi:hypothetical protein